MPRDIKRSGTELSVLAAPFVILGALFTASLYGALVGIPLLAVSWLLWRSGRLARRSPSDAAVVRRLRIANLLFSSALTSVCVGVAIVGANHVDSALDLGALVVGLAWVAGAWHATVMALRTEVA